LLPGWAHRAQPASRCAAYVRPAPFPRWSNGCAAWALGARAALSTIRRQTNRSAPLYLPRQMSGATRLGRWNRQ
jgi:hypothetical protein